jgi:hypothetical protein
MAGGGARCSSPGSNGRSGRRGDPTGRRMTGCRGCLGLLVVLALLAWLIEQLQPVLGWSNAQTGGFLLAGVALLAIGSSVRGRGGRRPALLMTISGFARSSRRMAWWRGTTLAPATSGRAGRVRAIGRAASPRPIRRARRPATGSREPAIRSPRSCVSASSSATGSAAATAVARAARPVSCCTSITSCRSRLAEPRRRTTCSLPARSATSARPPGPSCRSDPEARGAGAADRVTRSSRAERDSGGVAVTC